MNKREHQKGRDKYIPSHQLPNEALLRLSADAYLLYGFLAAFHDTIDGPLVDLHRDGRLKNSGLTERRIQRATQELIDRGYYACYNVRRQDGRLARDQWVTTVPGALLPPQVTSRRSPAAKTGTTSRNLPFRSVNAVRPAETSESSGIAAAQRPNDALGVNAVRPAETVAETGIAAAQRPNDALGVNAVRPAETHPADGVLPGQNGSGPRARTRGADREIDFPPPSPIDEVPAQRGPREGEGILITVGQARSWLALMPFRSKIPAATSLGPVVARFLSAPGPWPKDKLAELLCHDLAGADSVEAVLHGRLKRQNPYYDPADFAQAVPVEGTTVAIEGERIPIEALKPAKEMRITANDDFRQMRERERLRKAGAEGGPRG